MTDQHQQIRLLWDEEIDSLILDHSANLLEHVAALIVENPHTDASTIVNGYREHLLAHGINAEFPGITPVVVEEPVVEESNVDFDEDIYSFNTADESTVEEDPAVSEDTVEGDESLPAPVEFELDYADATEDTEDAEDAPDAVEDEVEHVETEEERRTREEAEESERRAREEAEEEERRAREDAEALAAYEAAISGGSTPKKKNFKDVLAHMTNIDKA